MRSPEAAPPPGPYDPLIPCDQSSWMESSETKANFTPKIADVQSERGDMIGRQR
jgi:hypothetical protein